MTSCVSRRTLGLGALAVGALAACGKTGTAGSTPTAGRTVSVTHAQGTTSVPADPKRLVVFDYGALDTINSLGLSDRVVGIPKGGVLPSFLKNYDSDHVAEVGSLHEPNIEAIQKLKPDLVVISFRSASKYPELVKHFTTIDISYPSTMSFYSKVEAASTVLANALDQSEQVKVKLGELRQVIDQAKAQVPQGQKGLILMTSAGKVTAYGAASRFGAVHSDLMIPQAITDIKEDGHGQPVSFEAIQQANPDLMFVCDRDAAIGQQGKAAQEVLSNELVASTSAWKNNKVVYLDGARWYIVMHGLENAKVMIQEAVKGL
ncbi:MAG: ABC transporter substrate-binding protein [Actinomycetia bacterium]|nr:ABC transporter substrate-binding protein [Actinomycetes bacterium]